MSSSSENSKPSSIDSQDHNAELMACIRNLGLGDCGETGFNRCFEVGSSSLSVSSEQGSKRDEGFYGENANGTLWKNYMDSYVPGSQPESPCRENIWAYHYSIAEGSHQPSYLQSASCNDGVNYLGYGPVTSPRISRPKISNTLPNYSSLSAYAETLNFSNQLHGTSMGDDQARYYNYAMQGNMLNSYNYYPINGVSGSNGRTSGGPVLDCFPEGVDLGTVAMTPTGSHILHNLLGRGDNETRNWILNGIYDSLPELMTDPNGHHIFQKLLGLCNDNEIQIIARKLTSENQFLLEAAFDTKGSYSVQKFIKKLKKSSMASRVTSILSTRFFEMMTHHLAKHVIKQCLNVLGFPANMVLYEAAIDNCYTLAVHCVGCSSINDCIDFIVGEQRDTLLLRLADQSAYLASDPSGNYVVQHVLKTRNPVIADRVCHSLRGHYRQLSTKKGGSHVIEMCVRYSILGMNLAVQEFLENPKALSQLAKDQFGNYVVQTILKITKLESIQLYEALVEALEPNFWFLERYKTGKSVVNLIKNLNQLEANELGR